MPNGGDWRGKWREKWGFALLALKMDIAKICALKIYFFV